MRIKTALAVSILTTLTIAAAAPGAPAPSLAGETVTAAPQAIETPTTPPMAAAPAPAAPQPVIVEAPAASAAPVELAPGEYDWNPERSTTGQVDVVVSIPQQLAYIYRGGELIGTTTVSTGRRGHETPTGSFPILEKRREHYSNLYNNAPMPFMQRLTWGGVALHAGHIPGRPASHGCIRLPLEMARLLFGVTRVGTTVHVLDASPSPEYALAMARGEPIRGRAITVAMNGSADLGMDGARDPVCGRGRGGKGDLPAPFRYGAEG
jgi:lipoprotein-anchoring transpeptidase ErfK/SrfK